MHLLDYVDCICWHFTGIVDVIYKSFFLLIIHGKKGQANVDVKTQGDTLIVYASCDSLQRIIEWYESELTRIRSETVTGTETVQTEIKHRFNPVQMVLIAFIAGMASGMVLIIVIKKHNGKK